MPSMDSAGKQLVLLIILLLLEVTVCFARDLSRNESRGKLYPDKPPVKTIKREDGDLIDCIKIYSQPAFAHPALENHTIQMEPSLHPGEQLAVRKTSEYKANGWRSSCPIGTIPVLRPPSPMSPTFTSKFVDTSDIHEYAYLYESGTFQGTKATFNVWNPQLEGQDGEFSLAQLWVVNDADDSNVNTIEAGWHVYPSLHGDNQTRLFVYWTSDNYNNTGCYNLMCAGFVQVSNQIFPGMVLSQVSVYEGEQFYINLLVFKDVGSGNWWLKYNDINVGYWPSSLFTTLATNGSNLLEWGGEVRRLANTPRLATKMGSGHFPSEGGDGISSSVKNIECVDTTNQLVQPTNAVPVAKLRNCYDINYVGSTANDGHVIYFGGPGKSDTCTRNHFIAVTTSVVGSFKSCLLVIDNNVINRFVHL